MEKEDNLLGGLAGPYAVPSPGVGSSRGLTEEDLQGPRQRKIDREGRGGHSRNKKNHVKCRNAHENVARTLTVTN